MIIVLSCERNIQTGMRELSMKESSIFPKSSGEGAESSQSCPPLALICAALMMAGSDYGDPRGSKPGDHLSAMARGGLRT